VQSDVALDIALIKLLPGKTEFKPVKIAKETAEIGENVTVLGFPIDSNLTLLPGIVSTLDEGKGRFGITAPVQAGQSGSPVFNMTGEVIAILLGRKADGSAVAAPIAFSRALLAAASAN
jgi:S1-C subfamily serine protease